MLNFLKSDMSSGVILLIAVHFVGVVNGQALQTDWNNTDTEADQKDKIFKDMRRLNLTSKGEPLEPKSKDFKEKISGHLFGETINKQIEVWKKMAELNNMVAKANNKKSASRDIEDVDAVVEGDIQLDKEDIQNLINYYKIFPEYMKLSGDMRTKLGSATFITKKTAKWKMPIKFKIEEGVSSKAVKEAIDVWEKETCIQFKRQKRNAKITGSNIVFRTSENRGRCASRVGRKRKSTSQTIWLSSGCQNNAIIIHEIGHALGFRHEQSRTDRNSFVTLLEDNIKEKKLHNFIRYPSDKVETYGLPYDYSSIMHYGIYAFSKKPGKSRTITANQPDYERTLGQRLSLSFYDIKGANWHYCQNQCIRGLNWSKCKHDGYKDPLKCNQCKCPDGWGGRFCGQPAKSLPAPNSCGMTFLTARGMSRSLASPRYNKKGYTPGDRCSWRIRAPPGHRILFQFKGTFRIRCHRSCRDYVEVRYSSTSKAGPRYCCRKRPSRIFKSTGTVMLINFRTFSGKRGKGFKASYKRIAK